MYCMGCGKPTNNSDGYCDKCLKENNDIFIDDNVGVRNQEPLFNDSVETQILEKPESGSQLNRENINLSKSDNIDDVQTMRENDYNNGAYSTPRNNNFQNQGQCKYCVSCGSQLHVMAKQCPQCGVEAGPLNEENGLLYGGIGCCIPVVGWILYFIWRDTKPKTAKKAMIGAIINIIAIVLFYILFFGMFFAMILDGSYYY